MNETLERTALRPWADQPRKRFDKAKMQELVDSLRSVGQLQPLIVRPLAEADGEVTHEIIVGERRWRASGTAGLGLLECRVLELTDKQAAELAVMENVHRDDLTVMEEAEGYKLMVRQGWDVSEISQRSGRRADVIYTLLALCDLDDETQRELVDETISRNTAQALGRIEDLEDRAEARERIVHPRTSDRPLPEKAAVKLIQEEYLAPQKRAKAWEGKRQALAREFPGVEIVPLKEAGRYNGPGSGWERADAEPQAWELAVHMRDQVVPTWGTLAEKHGAPRAVVPDAEGNPVLMVAAEPIRSAELSAGERNPEQCIFPIAGGHGRHEQSLAKQKVDAQKEAAERQAAMERGLHHIALMKGLWRELMAEPQGRGPLVEAAQRAKLRTVMEWLVAEDWLPDLDETMGTMGLDAEALGDGDAAAGAAVWARNAVEESGAMGFAAVITVWALGGMSSDAQGFLERVEPLARVAGLLEEQPDEAALDDARAAGVEAFHQGRGDDRKPPFDEEAMRAAWREGYEGTRQAMLEDYARTPGKKAAAWWEQWESQAGASKFAAWLCENEPAELEGKTAHIKAVRGLLND